MTGDLSAVAARVVVIGGALVIWFWTQRLIASRRPAASAGELGDRMHAWTAGWNAWLASNTRATNLLLIVSSASIDVIALWMIGTSVLGPTFRPFLGVLFLFGLRQTCQGLCAMPIPKGMIWRHPGVPSLLVTYGTSNDLFFSGHTALCVLGAIEVHRAGPPWLSAVAWTVAALQGVFVLALRAHYTVDVVAAVFAACCCDALAAHTAPGVDIWLRSLV
ncbi:MAG: sphingomyelin synthase family protein [Planctomycetes bacterium]|nr:sphingomyelin synthase family protein [Planctomycetota bacterium]